MRLFNQFLVRIFQWFYYVFFVFWVLTYYGLLLLFPLAALILVVNSLTFIGFPDLLALLFALPVVIYLGLLIRRSPDLLRLFGATGVGLVKLGFSQNKQFEAVVKSLQEKEVQRTEEP